MDRWTRFAAVVAALALGMTAPATLSSVHAAAKGAKGAKAKKAPADDADTKKAKEHFKKGKVFFDSGQFDKALVEYTAAYEMKPLPGFLLNIAQCHRNLGRFDESIFFYKKYLSEVPDTPYRSDVETVIAEMERKVTEKKAEDAKRLEAERAASSAAAAASDKARASEEASRAASSAEEARLRAEEEKSKLDTERAKRPFYQRAWFWGVIGGALLLAGGATAGAVYFLGGRLPDSTLGAWGCRTGDLACEMLHR